MKRSRPFGRGGPAPRAAACLTTLTGLLLALQLAGCPNNGGSDNPLTAVLSEGGILNPDAGGTLDGGSPGDGSTPTALRAEDLTALAPPDIPTTVTLHAQIPDGQQASFLIVVPPQHGTLSEIRPLDATRAEVVYTPDPGYSGADEFRYLVQNGQRKSQPGTVGLVVLPLVCFEATPTEGPSGLTALLRADTVGGQPLPQDAILTWQFDDQTEAGPVSTHATVSHTFRGGGIHLVRLSLTLAGITVPVGCTAGNRNSDTLRVTVYPTIAGQVLNEAGQPIAGVLVSADRGGTQMLTGPDGRYSLSVPYDWSGAVTAIHTDYHFDPPTWQFARVTRDLPGMDFLGLPNTNTSSGDDNGSDNPPDTGANRPPTAEDFGVQLAEDTQVTITLRGSDPDGDPLRYTIQSLPSHGWLRDTGNNLLIAAKDLPYTLSNDGDAVTYIPGPDYAGSDAFTYRASDGTADSETATVSLTITPVNDPPVIDQGTAISLTVEQDSSAGDPPNNFTLTASDPDAGSGELVWTICTPPAHGTAQIVSGSPAGPGEAVAIRYVPDAGYSGSDSFSVCVRDAAGAQDSGDVGVDVVPPTPSNTYYVDVNNPNASDNNPGTEALPFRTIQKAVTVVQAGDTILVKPGTYHELVEFNGSRHAQGTASHPIVVQSVDWYPGAAHDRALSVILDGDAQRDAVVKIIEGERFITIRGLLLDNSANKNLMIANSEDITIEDCISRNGHVDGISVSSTQGPERRIIIRRCVIHDNGNSGLQFRYSAFGVFGALVEDCDSYNNGALVTENAEGFEVFGPCEDITFRRCIAYNNISSNFAAVDPVRMTVEDCIGWGTTTQGDADGRSFILGLHANGTGVIVRRCVSFDSPRVGLMFTNSPEATGYNNTVFDCGFHRPGEVDPPNKSGIAIDGANGIYRNLLAFDNNLDFNGQPDPSARDIRMGTTSNLDSDYHFIGDGVDLSPHGPHVLTGIPQVTDKPGARQLADDYAAGRISRQAFFDAMRNLLRPASGSPLIDAGDFLCRTTSAGSATTVIPVDRDPRRFFRGPNASLGILGEQIQIDDGDGNPATKILVRIAALSANSITVDQPVSFSSGAGIALPYEGNKPDIGAYEAP